MLLLRQMAGGEVTKVRDAPGLTRGWRWPAPEEGPERSGRGDALVGYDRSLSSWTHSSGERS
jgi:hypothetical protein